MTQAILAARLGITPSEYWDVELHDDEVFTGMSVAELGQIAEILGMSLHVILFGPTAEMPTIRTPFSEITGRLAALVAKEGLTVEQLGERIGWDLAQLLENPESLGDFNIVGLRDVCRAVGVDWVTTLPTGG